MSNRSLTPSRRSLLKGAGLFVVSVGMPVGAELVYIEVRAVHHPRGAAPGSGAIVARSKAGSTDKGGAGDRPARCAHVGQVPMGRQAGPEMWDIGHNRPPVGGERRGDRPVVGAPAGACRGGKEGQVFCQAVCSLPG